LNKGPKEIDQLSKLDRNSFITEAYNRYGKKLYAYAVTHWNVTEDEAWDLIYKTLYKVQDTFKNYTFACEEKFASFIFRVFINNLRTHYRDNKKNKLFEFMPMDDVDLSTHEITDATETPHKKLKALNEVLDDMEDWERMLLLMRSEGRAYSDIATYIDKPENQLKVYYQRLKERLTKKLNGALQ
jgi:RNA polymerase sigma factor (sigma-70 family)